MDNYQRVKSFYKSRYYSFGNSIQSLGWNSSKEQLKRFEALTIIVNVNAYVKETET